MSGGSFNYLCTADFGFQRRDDLERMRDELRAIHRDVNVPALERQRAYFAFIETDDLLEQLSPSDSLREVWRAVEWWRSNDYSKDQVVEALSNYEPPIER